MGYSQDYQRAFFWYKKAAKRKRRDSVEAKFNLGRLYQQGLGCHRDLELAESWLREAVEDNYRPALYEYVALATEGVVQAQTNLGYFYWIGKTVSQNHQGSIYWTRLAPEQEDIAAIYIMPAQNKLGFFYAQGIGGCQIDWKSFSYYKSAAKRGDINALYNAGVLAQAGLGLNPPREDYLRAFGYYQ